MNYGIPAHIAYRNVVSDAGGHATVLGSHDGELIFVTL